MQLVKNYEVGCTECYRGVEGRNSGTSRYLNLVQNSGPLVVVVKRNPKFIFFSITVYG